MEVGSAAEEEEEEVEDDDEEVERMEELDGEAMVVEGRMEEEVVGERVAVEKDAVVGDRVTDVATPTPTSTYQLSVLFPSATHFACQV